MAAGSVIEAGDLLAGLELDDPSKARSITPFQGDSLGLEEASAVKQDALLTYRSIFDQLSTAMDGYDALGEDAVDAVGRLVEAISDPDVFSRCGRYRCGRSRAFTPSMRLVSEDAGGARRGARQSRCDDRRGGSRVRARRLRERAGRPIFERSGGAVGRRGRGRRRGCGC